MNTAMLGPIVYLIFLFIILFGCQLFNKDEVRNFIPGTYTRHYKDEYTDSYDTIQIKLISDNHYQVTKRSRFRRLNDNNIPVPGSQITTWLGTFDKGNLTLTPSGKPILFPEKGELRIGTEPYKKIKL